MTGSQSRPPKLKNSKIPRQLWLVGLWTRHLAHTRKVAGSILGRCHQIFQFHYIYVFYGVDSENRGPEFRKRLKNAPEAPRSRDFWLYRTPEFGCSRRLHRRRCILNRSRPFPTCTQTRGHLSFPLKKPQKVGKNRAKRPKTAVSGYRFLPNAPADRAQILREPQERQKEVPCQIWSSHHFWLAQNSPGKILSGVLFKNFFRGFTPDLRGEIRRGHTLPDGDQSLKISKP